MGKIRVDQLLVMRGLAESRTKAQAAIAAGAVIVEGVPAAKSGDMVEEGAALEVTLAHPWVSRAGLKLAHALEVFEVDPAGRVCLDVGASTGGFTEVLLAGGATMVIAVDVGRDQLHAKLRGDPRVLSLESVDARELSPDQLAAAPSLVVADVSFIGLAKALPRPLSLAARQADLVALVKPQFEAGPGAGRGGVLSERIARRAAGSTIAALDGLGGFGVQAYCESPIRGREGNIEFLVHARRV